MDTPLCDKYLLTIEEASDYFGIGQKKLREITQTEDCGFVLWIGSKRLIKRVKMEEFLNSQYSI